MPGVMNCRLASRVSASATTGGSPSPTAEMRPFSNTTYPGAYVLPAAVITVALRSTTGGDSFTGSGSAGGVGTARACTGGWDLSLAALVLAQAVAKDRAITRANRMVARP